MKTFYKNCQYSRRSLSDYYCVSPLFTKSYKDPVTGEDVINARKCKEINFDSNKSCKGYVGN